MREIARLTRSVYAPPRGAPWRIEELFPGSTLRYFSYARRALAAGLRAANVGAGCRVLLPELLCRDLLASVRAVGAQPLFYAVSPSLQPAEDPADWPKAEAVLAINYFGFPQDLAPFERYASLRGALLIEDNAHGLFGKDERGRALGSRAPLGLLSLRKTLPLPNGAALVLRSPEPSWRVPPQEPFADAGWRPRLKDAARRAFRLLGARGAARLLEHFRDLRGEEPPDPESERVLPRPERPCLELAAPIRLAEAASERSRRRRLYAVLESEAVRAGLTPLFPSLPEGTVPYAFPMRVAPEQSARAREQVHELGLRLLSWPDLPGAVAGRAPEHYRDIRLAHFLW